MLETFGEQFEKDESQEEGALNENEGGAKMPQQESAEAIGSEGGMEQVREKGVEFLKGYISNIDAREKELRRHITYEAPVFQEMEATREMVRGFIQDIQETPDPAKYLATVTPILLKLTNRVIRAKMNY